MKPKNKFDKDLVFNAVSERLNGVSFRDIAEHVFGVSARTERRWRQVGKEQFTNKVPYKTNVCYYYVIMNAIEGQRV